MKVGEVFTHRHWLAPGMKPLQCVVTAIRGGYVYWRTYEDGKPVGSRYYFAEKEKDRYVR